MVDEFFIETFSGAERKLPMPLSQHNKAVRKYPNSGLALSKSAKLNLRLYINPELKEGRMPHKSYHYNS